MAIGKARERWKGRRPKTDERDAGPTLAYEEGWYALLARQSAEGGTRVSNDAPADAAPSAQPPSPAEVEAPLAKVTELAPSRERSATPDRDAPRATSPGPGAPAIPRLGRSDAPPIRIGIRRVAEPEGVYLSYLASSPHRDYFRAELWRGPGPITPVHLWRANHLGAGWDLDAVDRFMEVASGPADDLVAAAPHAAQPGRPERRLWVNRLLTADWVREFGVGRVSKTLHPLLPELVPDLDSAMIRWARSAWLGLDAAADGDDPAMWIESWEALEDVLVLRTQELGQIVRRLRRLAPALGPVARFGPVLAAFWQSYWAETATAGTPDAGERVAETIERAPAPKEPVTQEAPAEPKPVRRTRKPAAKAAPASTTSPRTKTSTPRRSTARATTPRATTPRATTPRATTPRATTPRTSTPRTSTRATDARKAGAEKKGKATAEPARPATAPAARKPRTARGASAPDESAS
ncbi:MAG: hypothetical protein ACXWX0_03470 [Actinomycetota bacterium]